MITQGNWEVSKHATPDYAPQYGIYADGERNDLCTVKGENAQDNARLIAAAPELLAASRILTNCLSENPDDYPDMGYFRQVMGNVDGLCKAIAKAEQT